MAVLVDLVAAPLAWIGLGARAIGFKAPDLREYWNPDSGFASRGALETHRGPRTRAHCG